MFKVGDKVRNIITGNVLEILVVTGDILGVGNGGKVYAEWRSEYCEPYFENMPIEVKDRFLDDNEFDKYGYVFALSNAGHGWQTYSKDDTRLISDYYSHYVHTPDWKPREPLLKNCEGCKHYETLCFSNGDDCSTGAVCWEYRMEEPDPFYKGATPCHLAGKDNA